MNDGICENTHEWSSTEWTVKTNAQRYGVMWVAGDTKSNWTRFLNHASGKLRNVSMASDRQRFNRAYAFYSNQEVYSGDELFISYGRDYFKARAYAPEPPNVSLARPRPNGPPFES